jgi:hypothetical protein
MLICAYEDRRHYLPGLQLLAHSLNNACPGQRLIVWCPESLLGTFRRELPDTAVTVRAWPHPEVSGWSVKPSVLLKALAEGHDEVVWMDSDLIVTAEFRDRFDRSDAIVVASEPLWVTRASDVDRAERWGLQTARRFPNLINSCVIRVKPVHERVLLEWQWRLTQREYLQAQTLPFSVRSPHVRGDQDVLHALLTSTLFADVPVRFLRHGVDIAQCHMADGYTVRDRLRHAWRSLPPLIHSEGFKPWDMPSPRAVFLEVSPFVLVAQRYRGVLDGDTSWLSPSSTWGRGLRFLTRGEPNLAGILPALATQLQRALRIRTRLDGLVGHWRD